MLFSIFCECLQIVRVKCTGFNLGKVKLLVSRRAVLDVVSSKFRLTRLQDLLVLGVTFCRCITSRGTVLEKGGKLRVSVSQVSTRSTERRSDALSKRLILRIVFVQ